MFKKSFAKPSLVHEQLNSIIKRKQSCDKIQIPDVFGSIQYLMSLQQGFSSSDVFGQLVRGHEPSDAIDPGHEISVRKMHRFV